MEVEIEAIAARTDESPRRVRARVEKEGLADALASQILERKTIDRILEYVKLEEVPLVEEDKAVETLDQAADHGPRGRTDAGSRRGRPTEPRARSGREPGGEPPAEPPTTRRCGLDRPRPASPATWTGGAGRLDPGGPPPSHPQGRPMNVRTSARPPGSSATGTTPASGR